MEAVDPLDAFMETVATEIKNQPVSCVEKVGNLISVILIPILRLAEYFEPR